MVQNYHVETGKGEASSFLICVEFKHLRRSSRLPPTKRDYRKMQSLSTGTGRLPKKLKLADNDRPTDSLPTKGLFNEPATDGSTGETPTEPLSEHPSETPTNASATGTSATSELAIDKSSANCTDTAEALDFPGMDDLPTSAINIQIEGDETVDDISLTTHRAGYEILNEFFGQPAIGLDAVSDMEGPGKLLASTAKATHREEVVEPTVWSNTLKTLNAPQHLPSTSICFVSSKALDILDPDLSIASAATSESSSSRSSKPRSLSTDLTSYLPSKTHIYSDLASRVQHTAFVKRSILDDPAPWLEHVLTALETDDTSRKPNLVLGVLDDILTKGNFTICVKIMTSIAENWVECNRCIAKPAFDATQERSQEVERNKIGLHAQRLTSEYVSRQQNQKAYADEIAYLAIRELVEMEMQKLLADPKELTSEFRKESDYDTAIKHIEKGNADDARIRLRHVWKETYYWPMI
jgi:hypothetical protein